MKNNSVADLSIKSHYTNNESGLKHWLSQRITAALMVFFSLWLFRLAWQVGQDDATELILFIKHPLSIMIILCITLTAFYHATIGMQVVIEDYISHSRAKMLILYLRIFSIITILFFIVAIFSMIFYIS